MIAAESSMFTFGDPQATALTVVEATEAQLKAAVSLPLDEQSEQDLRKTLTICHKACKEAYRAGCDQSTIDTLRDWHDEVFTVLVGASESFVARVLKGKYRAPFVGGRDVLEKYKKIARDLSSES